MSSGEETPHLPGGLFPLAWLGVWRAGPGPPALPLMPMACPQRPVDAGNLCKGPFACALSNCVNGLTGLETGRNARNGQKTTLPGRLMVHKEHASGAYHTRPVLARLLREIGPAKP